MRKAIFLLLPFIILSCDDAPKKKSTAWTENQIETKRLKVKELMAIHDEAMPWMEKTHELKKELRAMTSEELNDSLQKEYANAVVLLDSADELMMAWMRSYREPYDTGSFDVAITYLGQEKEKITVVRDEMAKSIEIAESYLK